MPRYTFGRFELDPEARSLRRDGEPVPTGGKTLDTLAVLVENRGRVVDKEELLSRVWAGSVVEEANLTQTIFTVRKLLGDSPKDHRYIATVAGRGYQFVAQVTEVTNSTPPVTEPQVPPPEPRQAPRNKNATQVATVLALCAFVTGLAVESRRVHWFGQPEFKRITSLAILPLENLSGESGRDYFVDGMTDELISEVSNISALRVISRTSVMRYRRTQKPVQEIARDLHVDAVVEGAVLRSGNRVRITAHLIQAAPEAHLWTGKYERDLQDVMALQDDVARQIAREVKVKLTPQEQARLTSAHAVTPQAHEAYLKGRYLFNRRTDQGMEKSIDFFQQAVDAEPGYALAYAGLADSYCVLAGYGVLRPGEAFPKAEKAAQKALEIDNTLAEAHTALGYVQSCYYRDWQAAEREFRRALELNPNYATAHLWHGDHLATLGQAEAAIAEFRRARELDPISLTVNAALGRVLRDGRHFDEAIEQCRKTLELEPNFPQAHWCLGLGYLGKARYEEAILEFQKARALGEVPLGLWSLAYAYGVAGRKVEAREVLREFRQQSQDGYVSPYFMAEIYAGLGEKNQAFEWLEKAYNEGDFMQLKLDPFLDSLRSDPRFRDLLRRMNLPP